jgi:hypothetical protein
VRGRIFLWRIFKGNDRQVLCAAGVNEIVGVCSESEFETEKREALKF